MPASKAQRAATAKRRSEAVALRLTGLDYETIAQRLGYASRGAAYTDITRSLEASIAEQRRNTETMREEELRRLDQLLLEAWGVLKREHITVSHGRIIRGDDNQPIPDDSQVLQAIDRILKIQERRAKYLGLDAPTRQVVSLDAIDDEIARLSAELGEPEPSQADEASGTS